MLLKLGLASKFALTSRIFEPGVCIKADIPFDYIIYLDSSFIFFISNLYLDVELITVLAYGLAFSSSGETSRYSDGVLSYLLCTLFKPEPIDLLIYVIGYLSLNTIYPAIPSPLDVSHYLKVLSLFF